MTTFDIVIVGGGMVGQAFALSMTKTPLRIAVIEPNNPNPELNTHFHSRVSAITPKSQAYLQQLGVWDLIKRKYSFSKTSVWDENSHGNLNFSTDDENTQHLGHIIENDGIQSALFNALNETQTQFINAKLEGIEKNNDGYKLQLDNKTQLECGLLIGADGAQSRVRDLAGIEFSTTDYQQKAIICNIRSDKSFENTTWQRFLADSIIALLPLDEHQASIVWSAKHTLADELLSLPTNDFANRLSAGVEYRFGRFEVSSVIRGFPLIERSAKTYVKENLALIGDAAHTIHPLAGQGVNLGFADALTLSAQLNQSTKMLGDYGVLRAYARSRRLDNELMAKTMTALNWVYKENSEPMRWLRGFGMNAIDKSPKLKSFFQKHATGDI